MRRKFKKSRNAHWTGSVVLQPHELAWLHNPKPPSPHMPLRPHSLNPHPIITKRERIESFGRDLNHLPKNNQEKKGPK